MRGRVWGFVVGQEYWPNLAAELSRGKGVR